MAERTSVPENPEPFDAIVIGTGQSGPSLALRLAAAGRKTAILERKWLGGTCVNDGCIPTKTLIASARVAHMARRAADFGVFVDAPVWVDMARVKARKDAVVKQSIDGLTESLVGTANLELIHAHGRFESAHTVRVGERLLGAPQIFVNIGARAAVPKMPGLDQVRFLTNTGMMELDFLPEHLLIVGGSYIGLEFAQMMRRFGSQVTLVERGPRLISREDDEISEAIRVILEAEGIAVRLNAECVSVKPNAGGVTLQLGGGDRPEEIDGSHLLLAVGRRPNSDDLGCERAGLKLDPHGYIVVDDQLRTQRAGHLGAWAT